MAYEQDEEHLRLLALFHYILAGITALFACIPVVHVAMGLMIVFSKVPMPPAPPPGMPGQPSPQMFGWIFVVIGGLAILLGWALAAGLAFAGRCIAQRRSHTFCLIVAALSCLNFPFGTTLGVFTFVVLLRPSVKELFDRPAEEHAL